MIYKKTFSQTIRKIRNYHLSLTFDFCFYWETVFLQIPFQNTVLTGCECIHHRHRKILEQRREGIVS